MPVPFHIRVLDNITRIFHTDEETLLAILLTTVLVLITGIYLLWDTTKADLEQTIVLVGPSGAGKTSIFAKLTHPTTLIPQTLPSLTPSTSHFLLSPPPPSAIPGTSGIPSHTSSSSSSSSPSTSRGRPPHLPPPTRKFKIIDYPGHARLATGLRSLLEKEVKGKKRVAVVFVIDGSSSAKEKDVGAVVDNLLPLLPYTQSLPSSGTPPTPLLLLTSKLDLLPSSSSRSLSVPRLHTTLTRELNARRSAALASSAANTFGSAKIELLPDDDSLPTNTEGEAEMIEEILVKGGAGGKWRWEDWKGVSWAGGWVGGLDKGREKSRVTLATEGSGEKDGVEIVAEDGLGELKEWLWNLK